MNSRELLNVYESVAHLTADMLRAARAGDWTQLAALESSCAQCMNSVRLNETSDPLPDALREEKIRIIKQILADDREIRAITEPWMNHLSGVMRTGAATRKLSQSYLSSS